MSQYTWVVLSTLMYMNKSVYFYIPYFPVLLLNTDRGVFGTLSDNYDGAFLRKYLTAFSQ